MSNRRKIQKFCSDNQLKINNLEFIRCREPIYGDSADASYWSLELLDKHGNVCTYISDMGDTIGESVSMMLDDLGEDLSDFI